MNNLKIAYIIFAVVLLHLIVGFAWVIYKFSKKDSKKQGKRNTIESNDH